MKSDAFKTIVPLIKDPKSLIKKMLRYLQVEARANVLKSMGRTLPKGVSMDQVNAFLNSDLVPLSALLRRILKILIKMTQRR